MQNTEATFYFALSRLLNRVCGGSDRRTETNWIEANVVGGAVHGIAYLFAAQFLLHRFALWQQVLLLFPLAVGVWVMWLLTLYVFSLDIRLLRSVGLFRGISEDRAQSILIVVLTTVFAVQLWHCGSWLSVIGGIWIAAVAMNLAAAIVLALLPRDGSTVA